MLKKHKCESGLRNSKSTFNPFLSKTQHQLKHLFIIYLFLFCFFHLTGMMVVYYVLFNIIRYLLTDVSFRLMEI